MQQRREHGCVEQRLLQGRRRSPTKEQTHQGINAIRAWQHEARTKSEYTVTPIDISQTGERLTVIAEVVGSFPRSPAQLAHAFVMAGQKIQIAGDSLMELELTEQARTGHRRHEGRWKSRRRPVP